MTASVTRKPMRSFYIAPPALRPQERKPAGRSVIGVGASTPSRARATGAEEQPICPKGAVSIVTGRR